MTEDEWNSYVLEMRKYRDKFIAHLDDDLQMTIPFMDKAFYSTEFYYKYIAANEITGGEFHDLPADLNLYFMEGYLEAQDKL